MSKKYKSFPDPWAAEERAINREFRNIYTIATLASFGFVLSVTAIENNGIDSCNKKDFSGLDNQTTVTAHIENHADEGRYVIAGVNYLKADHLGETGSNVLREEFKKTYKTDDLFLNQDRLLSNEVASAKVITWEQAQAEIQAARDTLDL